MRTLIKISNKLDSIVQENINRNRRIISFNNNSGDIWRGVKRYAH